MLHCGGRNVPELMSLGPLKLVMKIDSTGNSAPTSTTTVMTAHQILALVLDAAHHFSPLAPARSTLKSLIAMKQMSTTHRKSSTEIAEPMPIWSWPIDVR